MRHRFLRESMAHTQTDDQFTFIVTEPWPFVSEGKWGSADYIVSAVHLLESRMHIHMECWTKCTISHCDCKPETHTQDQHLSKYEPIPWFPEQICRVSDPELKMHKILTDVYVRNWNRILGPNRDKRCVEVRQHILAMRISKAGKPSSLYGDDSVD